MDGKRGRGRPVERPIEGIPATAAQIRDAIFRAADPLEKAGQAEERDDAEAVTRREDARRKG